jgi:hypothetical protein
MERPVNGVAKCTFCTAYKIKALPDEGKQVREKVASSLREFMIKESLPPGIEPATGSTIILCKLSLSRSSNSEDDFNIHSESDKKELQRIISLFQFLDEQLNSWNNQNLISLISFSS